MNHRVQKKETDWIYSLPNVMEHQATHPKWSVHPYLKPNNGCGAKWRADGPT